MSLTKQQEFYSSSPPPPYITEGSQRSNVRLPPMSSLLPRPHHMQAEQREFPYVSKPASPPQARQTTSPEEYYPYTTPQYYNSEVRPQLQQALAPSQYSQIPGNRSSEQHEPLIATRRQAKKIVQRKEPYKEEQGQSSRESISTESPYTPAMMTQAFKQEPHSNQQSFSSEPQVSPRYSQKLPISGLLSQPDQPSVNGTGSPSYTLVVRQQPKSARACGFGERDRRVIDPPPILVLDFKKPSGDSHETYVVHCTLYDPETGDDASAMPITTERRQQRRLMGTNIASPFFGKDENNLETCFFTFPDLSVRTPGTFSLKFSLVVLDPMKMCNGYSAPVKATVMSNPFNVFNAKDFGGMRASTNLTKALKAQGCLIPVKKGNPKSNNARDDDDDEDDDEDDNSDGDCNDKGKAPAKRAKR